MARTLLRGRVLSFVDEPQGLDDTGSYRYWEDGEVEIADGKIVSVGQFDGAQHPDTTIVDHRGKLILPGLHSNAILLRFERERQALAHMNHAHVAQVFDAGTTGDGRPDVVME